MLRVNALHQWLAHVWRSDRGDQTTGYILITATAVTIALAVGAIFYDTMIEAASSIDLGVDE
ncbi:hypothetical protein F4561_005225 [Lipingzhangella halophila]|uniref:Flp pilus assembly pilin Flp n=1 Tax=Lipingzhangella halophila TaxID=1783352 RepID=A0A7W7RLX4_9ACTN|nr:hypothetical protein [Lipingzhangella halophila]MBB4934405.1 hypothetical protein [Lipingzhangella halophila]